MDIDAMSPEELKAKVRELLKQKEEDDATIARLREQIGGADGGGAAAPAAPREAADPSVAPVKTEQEMAAEMEKQKQAMIDAMLADGTISQEEYEDMMERNRREKEVQQLKARRKKAWCVPCCACCPGLIACSPSAYSRSRVERTLLGGWMSRAPQTGTRPRRSGTRRGARKV